MMLLKRLIVLLLVIWASRCGAQDYKFFGKVTNNRLEPIAFASVQVNGRKTGILTKEDGTFALPLNSGVYEISFTMIGYQPQVVKIVINKEDFQQNIILIESSQSLEGVVVRSRYRDKAEDYIRRVIRHKDSIRAASGGYSCDVYIKAVQQDSSAKPVNRRKSASPKDSVFANYNNMALAEIALKLYRLSPNKLKEERNGVKLRGPVGKLYYLTTTDGSFDVYDNIMKVPEVSPAQFLSPVSYSGLIAYRYRTASVLKTGNHNIYTIEFKPGKLSNATITGWLTVDDSSWTILQTHFSLPVYHLPEYDYFAVDQNYTFVNDQAWMPVTQQFTYFSKSKSKKISGTTTASFSNFTFHQTFARNFFGPEVSAATDSAYRRDSIYWGNVRTTPLTTKELGFIHYKDSIYAYTHTKAFLDSMDRVANKVTWKKILYQGQPLKDHEKGTLYIFPSIAAMFLPYVTRYGGPRIAIPFRFYKTDPVTKKAISLSTDINYGFLNKDVNGGIDFSRKYNAFNQATFQLRASRDFAMVYVGDAWINQLRRNNYYLNNAFGGGWGRELVNGLFIKGDIDIALRRSLKNYKTLNFVDSIIIRDLGEKNNTPPVFDPYNALYGRVELNYTPFQPYIREPDQKIILESKWPTAYVVWKKGIPDIFARKVNFDYLELGLRQTLRLGTLGISNYTIRTGSFLNTKRLEYIDNKFQRRGDPWLFMNPNEAFQALDSTFPVQRRFYEGHYFHEFNGALLNKMPVLKKLGLREVAGTGFLLAKERNLRYAEIFAGVERVFKLPFSFFSKAKIGCYVVASAANKFSNPVQFKFGITGWDDSKNTWR